MSIKLFLKNRVAKIVGTLTTKSVNVSTYNKQIVIRNTPRIDELKLNQFVSLLDIPDTLFYINKIIYDTSSNTYTLSVSGNIISDTSFRTTTLTIYDTVYDAIDENAELDIEEMDLETLTQIQDINDVSSKRDKISKQIVLKGTENNKRIFGQIQSFNKYVNSESPFKLYEEYNGIKQVDAQVFQDGILVFYGKLILEKVSRDSNGNLTYVCTILGELQSFKGKLGDAKLSDLDLIDLTHEYTIHNIRNSWNGFKGIGMPYNVGTLPSTQTYNWQTDLIQFTPTEFGKNYTYPYIDYGDKFTNLDEEWDNYWNNQFQKIKLQNFRPAIYVKEYLKRIAEQIGYEIEIKGSEEFKRKFDKLIIPNNQEKFRTKKTGVVGRFRKPILTSYQLGNPGLPSVTGASRSQFNYKKRCLLFYAEMEAVTEMVEMTGNYGDGTYSLARQQRNLFRCKRSFESIVELGYNFDYATGSFTAGYDTRPRGFKLQIVRRNANKSWEGNNMTEVYYTTPAETDNEVWDWDVLYEKYEYLGSSIPSGGITRNFNGTIELPITEFTIGDEVQVRIVLEPNDPGGISEDDVVLDNGRLPLVTVYQFDLRFGKDNIAMFYEPQIGDKVTPIAPELSQIEFLKSLADIYNLMIYPDPDNENKIIFQTYDDYYVLTNPEIMPTTSLDWTNKVDWNQAFDITSNIEINKDYLFTFEEDSDVLNENYKKLTSRIYSDLEFKDSFGLKDKKEVKPKFSASVPSENGTNRLHHALYKGDNYLSRESMETKPRILFHSGVYACSPYDVVEENLIWEPLFGRMVRRTQVRDLTNGTNNDYYCLATNYLFNEEQSNRGTPWTNFAERIPNKPLPIEDIHYFRPNRFYFNIWNDMFMNFDGSYKYYRNRISEITNISLKTIECMVQLNVYDLNMLDLKVPIFIDSPYFGAGYFKILEVVSNYGMPFSKVKLQQII